jgi:hypothetical protein
VGKVWKGKEDELDLGKDRKQGLEQAFVQLHVPPAVQQKGRLPDF